MNHNQEVSLKRYYDILYGGEPKSDSEAINRLIEIAKNLLKPTVVTHEIKEGIAETYRMVLSEKRPAYYWMVEAFHVVSKKRPDKRTFPYTVGIIRKWLNYGFGYIPSREENELVEYFEETFDTNVSDEARRLLKNYMSEFGVIKVTRVLGEIEKKDISYAICLYIGNLLKNKFSYKELAIEDSNHPINEQKNNIVHKTTENQIETIKLITHYDSIHEASITSEASLYQVETTRKNEGKEGNDNIPKVLILPDGINKKNNEINKQVEYGKRSIKKKNRKPSADNEQLQTEASFVELILKENKTPMRLTDLFRRLEEYGVEVKQKSITSKIITYMKHNPNIIKKDIGLYTVTV